MQRAFVLVLSAFWTAAEDLKGADVA